MICKIDFAIMLQPAATRPGTRFLIPANRDSLHYSIHFFPYSGEFAYLCSHGTQNSPAMAPQAPNVSPKQKTGNEEANPLFPIEKHSIGFFFRPIGLIGTF